MLSVYAAVRALHILGGALGLVSMFVPLLSRKGSPLHRRVGTVFAWSMIVAGISGVLMSATWLLVPTAFTDEAGVVALRVRGLFLGTIGLLMLGAVQQMLRSLTRKRSPAPRASRLDVALPATSLVVGAITAIAGLRFGAPLPIVFGVLTAVTSVGNLRFVLRPLRTPKAWWYQHMTGAMVAMISAITAFAVFGGARLMAGMIPSDLRWVPWIAPAVIIVPLFQIWIAKWRRRFGEDSATAQSRPRGA